MNVDENQSIVVTGTGLATGLGLDPESTWEAVRAGRCGVGPLTAMEQRPDPDRGGGQAMELPVDFAEGLPREVRYLRWVIGRAMREAGLLPPGGRGHFGEGTIEAATSVPPYRRGTILGTTLHGMRAAGEFLRANDPAPLRHFLAGATSADALAGSGFDGLSATTCSACSSGLGAIALAVTLLRAGEYDVMLAGGYDTISEYAYGGFNALRLVAEGPLRPFTRGRQGMKLAEGYGVLVLEREWDARRRGATILGRILGYGESADAHHLTQPHPTGEGAARAIRRALSVSGLSASQVGLVAAHATGTPDNDAGEFAALSQALGDAFPSIPVTAFKSHLGHTLGGAGAVELILSLLAMRHQTVPPVANVRAEEVEFASLNLVTTSARPAEIRSTLNTSLGFGGANTCMILGEAGGKCPTAESRSRNANGRGAAVITGIGLVLPGIVGNDAFVRRLTEAGEAVTSDTGAIAESTYLDLLNARRVRRMSDYVKTTLAATALALKDAGIGTLPADAAAILGTTHGSANYSGQYYGQIVREGINAANPMLFAEGVPNAAAAHLSMTFGVKGACQTIIGVRTAGLDALRLAALRISSGEWTTAIVSAGEEYDSLINRGYQHCGVYAGTNGDVPFGAGRGFVMGAASVTFVLERADVAAERGARVRGAVLDGRAAARGGAEGVASVLGELGRPGAVVSSANGSWIDRVEEAGIRRAGGRAVASVYGHVAESFSAGPLLGIAAVLLGGKLPRSFGSPEGLTADGSEACGEFVTLATDYAGAVSGVRIGRG